MMDSTERDEDDAPTTPSDAAKRSADHAGLDRVIQAQIGDKLRTMYDQLVEQPVPDRLADIIKRLGEGR